MRYDYSIEFSSERTEFLGHLFLGASIFRAYLMTREVVGFGTRVFKFRGSGSEQPQNSSIYPFFVMFLTAKLPAFPPNAIREKINVLMKSL